MNTDLSRLTLGELLRQAEIAERSSQSLNPEVRIVAEQFGDDVQRAITARLEAPPHKH